LILKDQIPTVSSLTAEVSSVEEDIVIYKLSGEKLGLRLHFEGGSRANEYVKHLFVQSTAVSSPAAKTKCTWPEGLRAGDEILSISGKNIKKLTKLDCVRALKGNLYESK
jgi:C-terminal processing protease CtpA/Prc